MAICNGYGITGQVLECRKSLGPIQKNCRALTALPIYSVTDGAGFCKQPTLPGLAWTRAVTWSFSDDSLIDLTGQREKMVRHLACTIISSAMVNKSIELFSFGALELNKLYVLYCIVMFSR